MVWSMTAFSGLRSNLRGGRWRPAPSIIQEASQYPRAAWVLQLSQRLGLDLADASRVTENCWPTSSSVWSLFMPMPKRMLRCAPRAASRTPARCRGFAQVRLDRGVVGRIAFLSSMKSPRCESASSPIGVSSDNGSLAILSTLRTFSSGMRSSRQLLGVGSRPILSSLARTALELVDWSRSCHRDPDGARLIRDGAGDRLPDPPGGVGGEFEAAAIVELVDRLHQADIASWIRSRNCRTRLVYLRDPVTRRRFASTIPSWLSALRARPSAPCARSCGTRRSQARSRPRASGSRGGAA